MSLTRKCGACGQMITTARYYEITIRLLKTDGPEEQKSFAQCFDDYCMSCIENGSAIKDLFLSLDPGEKP